MLEAPGSIPAIKSKSLKSYYFVLAVVGSSYPGVNWRPLGECLGLRSGFIARSRVQEAKGHVGCSPSGGPQDIRLSDQEEAACFLLIAGLGAHAVV